MTTEAGAPFLLRRVAVRAGVGIWRHRGAVLLAAVVSIGLAGYAVWSTTGLSSLSLTGAGPVAGANDCADTAMAAIADKSSTVDQQAYQCMDSVFQQRVPESVFAEQMQAQALPNVSKLARVGDYKSPDGGTLVYYAVEGANQSVGYIVYLSNAGKVLKIE